MLSLFTKDDTWFVIRIPSTQIKTKATDKTSFIFDLVQGDFIVTANTNSVRYAMDNSGDALLILNKLHQIDFAIAKAPDKCMRLDAQRLCKLVEAKHGAPKVLNTPSNSVGTNRKKSSLNIPVAERTRFKGMLADVKIEGRYPPMEHQIDAAWFKANNHKAFDLSTMRTGKTGSTMRVSGDSSAREALTSFRVLERFEAGNRDDGYTLVECKLFTGRTHQIRVHMQYIHHCIVGDPLYGSHGPHAQLKLDRQFLHSYRLGFVHPSTGEYLQFTDYLPGDLQAALGRIESRTIGRTPAGEEVIAALGEAAAARGLLVRGE